MDKLVVILKEDAKTKKSGPYVKCQCGYSIIVGNYLDHLWSSNTCLTQFFSDIHGMSSMPAVISYVEPTHWWERLAQRIFLRKYDVKYITKWKGLPIPKISLPGLSQ